MQNSSIFSAEYWKSAAANFKNSKMLAYAALVCALRIAVKAAKIPLGAGVTLTFDCYVNAIGAIIYGPLLGLGVGAISDTVGAFLFPTGDYFFPFIFVETSSSFIFALFFWKRKISVPRALLAKFTVNFFCNIILTSLVMKWMYALYYTEKTYYLFNALRIVKNLVLFPLEGVLICLLLNYLMPIMKRMRFVPQEQEGISFRKRDYILLVALSVLALGLVLFYVLFFKDFLTAHNLIF